MNDVSIGTNRAARPLVADDIERVVAIDRAHSGHTRRSFFEKRFAAAAAHPDDYILIGLMRGGSMRGFATARILRGEFGREHAVALLDGLGVAIECQEMGVGHELINELLGTLSRMGVRSLQSQAGWKDHNLVRFFASSGFELAPRLVLERATQPLDEVSEDI